MDNAAHWISHFPVEKALSFSNTYPVDSDLFGELCYPTFDELGLVIINLPQLTGKQKSDKYPIIMYSSYYWLIHIDPVPKFTGKKLESVSSMDHIFIENRFAFFSIMRFIVSETF